MNGKRIKIKVILNNQKSINKDSGRMKRLTWIPKEGRV
jgi:hypothetical protein